MRAIASLLLTGLLAACATSGGGRPMDIELTRLLDESTRGEAMMPSELRAGLRALEVHDLETASRAFNAGLQLDPRNSTYHFLNALTYHLMASDGYTSQYPFAQTGYEITLGFEPGAMRAIYQLARLHLEQRRPRLAQDYFARGLLIKPDSLDFLMGLAAASYTARDLAAAEGAIARALEIAPDEPGVQRAAAVINAASGRRREAQFRLADYTLLTDDSTDVARVTNRLADWDGSGYGLGPLYNSLYWLIKYSGSWFGLSISVYIWLIVKPVRFLLSVVFARTLLVVPVVVTLPLRGQPGNS